MLEERSKLMNLITSFTLARIIGVLFSLLPVCTSTHAKIIEEQISVPVTVKNMYRKEISESVVVTLFYDSDAPKPMPIYIFGHGREIEHVDRMKMGRVRYSANSSWFARLGFMVAVPTRIGYGVTGGDDVEDSGDCNRKVYTPGYEAATDQTIAVLEVLKKRPDVTGDRTVIMGQSYGGTSAISVAARNIPGVKAVINFAGGGGGNPVAMYQNPCSEYSLRRMFGKWGVTARTPSLWVYTENDEYFGPKYPKGWFEAFKAEGGIGEYLAMPAYKDKGHGFWALAPELWRAKVLEWLKSVGFSELREKMN
jgi:dienelactone hydrolase